MLDGKSLNAVFRGTALRTSENQHKVQNGERLTGNMALFSVRGVIIRAYAGQTVREKTLKNILDGIQRSTL